MCTMQDISIFSKCFFYFLNNNILNVAEVHTSGICGPVFLLLSSMPFGFSRIFSASSAPMRALGLNFTWVLLVVISSMVWPDGFRWYFAQSMTSRSIMGLLKNTKKQKWISVAINRFAIISFCVSEEIKSTKMSKWWQKCHCWVNVSIRICERSFPLYFVESKPQETCDSAVGSLQMSKLTTQALLSVKHLGFA